MFLKPRMIFAHKKNIDIRQKRNNMIYLTIVSANPYALCVNPLTNAIYVTHLSGFFISAISGNTNTVINTITVAGVPDDIAVNP